MTQLLGPAVEGVGRVAGRLGFDAAAQAQIGEIGGQVLECRVLRIVDQRHRDPVLAQQVDEFRDAEAVVPDLDDMADRPAAELGWQQLQEPGEIAWVELLERRELPQDRAEFFPQLEKAAVEEPLHVRLGRGQLLALRQEARALQREDEIVRRLVVPLLEAGRGSGCGRRCR